MKYKEKRLKHAAHFGDGDIIIQGMIFNAVHVIPDNFSELGEVDFYVDSGDDLFLLRLCNTRDRNQVTFVGGELTYVIFEKMVCDNLLDELNSCVATLRRTGIPKLDVNQSDSIKLS